MEHIMAVIVTIENGEETRQNAWIELDTGERELGLSMVYIYAEKDDDVWYKAINAKSPRFVSIELDL